jgi:hypothetical protein
MDDVPMKILLYNIIVTAFAWGLATFVFRFGRR